jgi:MerR family transcriptional regulator, light-induced transcriptional regulator
MAKALFTPKDLADAIGVSESSMRRWIDSGQLKMTRTAGGHRRVERVEAIRFLRETGTPLVRPEILGLGEVTTLTVKVKSPDEHRLFDALAAGDRALARGLVVSWHLAGRSLASIFDGPLRAALTRLGELWIHERGGIMIEHRATDICIEMVHHLRALLPHPAADAPLAIGATPQDEWHSLPSQMAAAVARERGLRDMNFGGNVPVELLQRMIEQENARVVWLSVTMKARTGVRAQVQRLAEAMAQHNAMLVLGGRSAAGLGRHPRVHQLASMSEFAAFLDGLRNGHRN